jgi:hypothetical protein
VGRAVTPARQRRVPQAHFDREGGSYCEGRELPRKLDLVQANSCHDHMYRSVEAILGRWKRREPLAWWVPAARLKLFAGLTGLLNPSFKSGTKLFQPYFMNCFNCASPRCVGPPIMRQPKFPLACALFTTLCLKIDNKACLKNTFVRRNSQSIVGSDRTRTFLRDTRARGAGG